MTIVFPSIAMVRRELLSSMRGEKSWVLLGGMTLGLLITISTILYLETAHVDMTGLLWGVMFGLSWSACLLITPLAATSICIEKQQGTFELLRVTLIRPWGIFFAKLIDILAFFVFFVIGVMPVVGVIFFFVGVGWVQFFAALLLVVILALACGSVGILCSAYFRRSVAAVVTSYLGVLVFLGLPGCLMGILVLILRELHVVPASQVRDLIELGRETFPLWCPAVVIEKTMSGEISLAEFEVAVVSQGVFIAACWIWGARILSRSSLRSEVEGRESAEHEPVPTRTRARLAFPFLEPFRREVPIPDARNAVFVRELRNGFLSGGTARIRLVYICAMIAFVMSWVPLMQDSVSKFDDRLATVWFALVSIILLVTPGVLANAMAKEHELGNLDMLRSTLLRPSEIIVGKLAGGLATLAPMVFGALVGMIPVFIVASTSAGARAICVSAFGTLIAAILLLGTLTLRVVVRQRRTGDALINSYSTGMAWYIYAPLILLNLPHILRLGGNPYWRGIHMEETFLFYMFPSPLGALSANFGVHLFDEPDRLRNTRWLCNILSCVLFSLLLLWDSIRVYARRVARDR